MQVGSFTREKEIREVRTTKYKIHPEPLDVALMETSMLMIMIRLLYFFLIKSVVETCECF